MSEAFVAGWSRSTRRPTPAHPWLLVPRSPRKRASASPAIATPPRTGSFSGRPGTGREVTLIAREAIAAVNAEGEVTIGEHETRRNLVTEGVPLADLVDRTFRVGDVVLHGRRLAEPCAYLERMTRAGVRDALSHRGGLRADIVTSGILRVGDEIREVEARDVVARG